MKKLTLILLVVAVLAVALTAAGWPARLKVINKSEDAVYIRLDDVYPQLTTEAYTTKTFTVTKAVYSAEVTACGITASGVMDLRTNLKLNFNPCWNILAQPYRAQFLGEPTMEKPNWLRVPGEMWRFLY
jgi:hypothetical protein